MNTRAMPYIPYRYSFFPLGDSAVLIDFGNVIDEVLNDIVLQLFYHLKEKNIKGVVDMVPAYSSLAIFYDAPTIAKTYFAEATIFDKVVETIQANITDFLPGMLQQKKEIKIPVCYDEKYAFDLNSFLVEKNITSHEVIHLHSSVQYRVYMIGFLPGFAYMGEVDKKLEMARKKEPRLKVPGGSVGIAGKQTGIYPVDAPGGWQIIGRTPAQILNTKSQKPVLFQPGDVVTFYPITVHEFENYQARIV